MWGMWRGGICMSPGIYLLLTAKSLRPNTCRGERGRDCRTGGGEISGVLWRQADAQLWSYYVQKWLVFRVGVGFSVCVRRGAHWTDGRPSSSERARKKLFHIEFICIFYEETRSVAAGLSLTDERKQEQSGIGGEKVEGGGGLQSPSTTPAAKSPKLEMTWRKNCKNKNKNRSRQLTFPSHPEWWWHICATQNLQEDPSTQLFGEKKAFKTLSLRGNKRYAAQRPAATKSYS